MLFFLKILFTGFLVFAQSFPAPQGHVNDFANLLKPQTKLELESQLASFKNTAEIAVVTIETLNGDTIENYSEKLFSSWGLGDKKRDNGLLFLISKQDRKVRLEVGYGLEEYLPDGVAGEILSSYVTPHFKNGDYDSGVSAGILQIKYVLENKILPVVSSAKSKTPDSLGIFLFILQFAFPFLIYLFAFLARSQSIWAGGLIGFAIGYLVHQIPGLVVGTIVGLVLDWFLSTNYKYFKNLGESTGFRPTRGGFYSPNSGGFWRSGGGGFGGGRSGGGGASRSW